MVTARPEAADGLPAAERSVAAPRSLAAIYRQWLKDVCRWAAVLGGPGLDADDVAQEVFLVVQRRLPRFEGEDYAPWLYAITTRVVMGARRRAWVRRVVLGGWHGGAGEGEDPFAHLTDPAPSPDEQVQRSQDRRLLEALLGRMSAKRRTVLALCELGGYTPEEIARLEGVPAATVRSRLFEARREFLRLVAAHRAGQAAAAGRSTPPGGTR